MRGSRLGEKEGGGVGGDHEEGRRRTGGQGKRRGWEGCGDGGEVGYVEKGQRRERKTLTRRNFARGRGGSVTWICTAAFIWSDLRSICQAENSALLACEQRNTSLDWYRIAQRAIHPPASAGETRHQPRGSCSPGCQARPDWTEYDQHIMHGREHSPSNGR